MMRYRFSSIFVEVRVKRSDPRPEVRRCETRALPSSKFARSSDQVISGVKIILGLYVYICTRRERKHTRTRTYIHIHDTRATRAQTYAHVCTIIVSRRRIKCCMLFL